MGNQLHLNIYSFEDHRVFLRAWLAERKRMELPHSYRWLSVKSGFTSPNFFKLVIDGDRNFSAASTEKVLKLLKLNAQESDYFRKLVALSRARNADERSERAAALARARSASKTWVLSAEQFEYYASAHHVAIREYLSLEASTTASAEEIAKHLIAFKLNANEVTDSLDMLQKLGLIKQVRDKWELCKASVSAQGLIRSAGVKEFHRKMIAEGARALDRLPSQLREVSGVTVGLSKENFEKVRARIAELRSEIMRLSEEDAHRDNVYQVNFQAFPLTAREGLKK